MGQISIDVEVLLNIGWAPDSAMAQERAAVESAAHHFGSETVSGVSIGILNRCVSSYQRTGDRKY